VRKLTGFRLQTCRPKRCTRANLDPVIKVRSAHRQMIMPKPVCPSMATATALGPPGAQKAQKQHAGLLKLDAQPSAAESVFPRARHGRSLPRSGELASRDTYAASGPNREPGRILIPGDGAAGDQEAQNRPACPAMAATRRLRAAPSQRPPGAMVSGTHAVL